MNVCETAVFLCIVIGASAGVWAAPGRPPIDVAPTDVVVSDLSPLPRQDSVGRAHHLSIGASRATKGQFPYIVSVQLYREHGCGGSIITHHTVITAAQCIKSPLHPYEVVAGDHDLKAFEGTEQRRSVVRYAKHRNYTTTSRVGFSPCDIVVLFLDRPFLFTQYVKPIKLAYPNTIPKGNAVFSGWGVTNELLETEPDVLMAEALPVVNYRMCLQAMKNQSLISGVDESNLPDTIMCTGPLEGGKGPCVGDSGGPLVQDGVLVGVASWGPYPCGLPRFPSGYTRVSAFTQWILVADRFLRLRRPSAPALPRLPPLPPLPPSSRYIPGSHQGHHHHHLLRPFPTSASAAEDSADDVVISDASNAKNNR